jgi:hypothetical protein
MDDPATSRGTAFGLAIEADFALPGLHGAAADGALPSAVLKLGDEAQLDRVWRAGDGDATRLSEDRIRGGEPGSTIDVHPAIGYRLFARYFGSCLVSPDGARLMCVPPPVRSWRWQRFLVGRCLPMASMLSGYEVIHAGAVELGGGVIAIIGPSGTGKTSLTVRLVLRGAGFFTDDVLALDARGEELQAHPGFGVVNVRAAEHERLGPLERAALGPLLGQTGRDKRHYAMTPVTGPRTLRAVYFLVPGDGRPLSAITPLAAPEPRRLLTSAFIHEVRPPETLGRLLDVCARLSATVPMFEVGVGGDEGAAGLAGRLREHVEAAA